MVDVKEIFDKNTDGFPRYEISDPERSGAVYTVKRLQRDYPFYEVAISKGTVPLELQGKYTRHRELVDKVLKYLETKREPGTGYKAKKRFDEREAQAAQEA